MLLIDVHCHLELFKEEVSKVVERAENAGVRVIITSGMDSATNRKALSLSRKFKIVKPSLGIYPTDKLSYPEIEAELKFISGKKDKIVAVGEIGLDYTLPDKKKQQDLFESQLFLAEKVGKPVIVHSREAEADVIKMLKGHSCKAVLHAFHGSVKLVREAAESGIFFSIPSNIGRSEQFQRIVKEVPLSHLLTETDAPFLAPEKGQRSEPAFVAQTVKKIAEIKGLDEIEAANIIYSNYQNLFS
ncbi:TatD family hydrolase [Candidatus Woesearchaeota archaeon]|nr:TatD family hydrolase [Candidatus Woesearchaeota archaeon]